jgi:hypothetical protein
MVACDRGALTGGTVPMLTVGAWPGVCPEAAIVVATIAVASAMSASTLCNFIFLLSL